MKIISLEAENVKRLKAVEIAPDGDLVVIGGKNAAGKSSVLDSIWLALGGGKASKETPLPIREGETRASVRLDLGDLVVTRTWTKSGTRLRVENGEGAEYKSPQSMLDALVGQLSFDPLAFTRLSPKDQRDALADLVGIQLDGIDKHAQGLYAQRTQIGREGKALGDPVVDESLPTKEESATRLIAQIQEAQTDRDYLATTRRQLEDAKEEATVARAKIEELQRRVAMREEEAKNLQHALDTRQVEPIEPLQERLAAVEETNQKIRANNQARELQARKNQLRAEYDSFTDELENLEEAKQEALARAEFPVEGLGFDEDGVTYRGVPLQQASSAEQIRVSLAMGMALNPRLKVLMIKDGSLLDADSMAAIQEQITDGGYQLWLERVGDADQGAVIITDGEVTK